MKRNTPPSNEGQPLDKRSCPLDVHVEFIRSHKTELVEALYDIGFTLSKVEELILISHREYKDLKTPNIPDGEKTVNLLDMLVDKGETTCEGFVSLLRHDTDMTTTFRRLEKVDWTQLDTPPASRRLSERTQNQLDTPSGPSGSEPRSSQRAKGASLPDQNRGPKTSLDGYIHNVSGLKVKNKQYFLAMFQERHQTRKMVVFQTNLRDSFLSAQNNKSPVRLLQVSFKMHENVEVINVNESSKLQILPEDLPFPFDHSHQARHATLAELQTNKENYLNKVVTVNLEVLQRLRVGRLLTRDKRYSHRTEYLVADHTAASSLTVWEQQDLAEKTWYCISNLTVTEFSGFTLQTTTDSVLTGIQCSLTSVAPSAAISPPKTYAVNLDGFDLNPEKLTCRGSHLLEKVRGKTVRCELCPMTYKRKTLRRVFTGRLCVQGTVRFLELEDCHIRELLGDEMVDDHKNTHGKLLKALSKIETVTVTVCDRHLLSVRAGNGLLSQGPV